MIAYLYISVVLIDVLVRKDKGMINRVDQVLFRLIQQTLWKTEYETPRNVDLNKVLDEANAQAVTGFVQVPSFDNSAFEIEQTVRFTQYMVAQDDLVNLLTAAHIPFVIIKGSASAVYYSEPFRRTMGDIDLVVPTNRFSDAVKLLAANGYLQEGTFDRTKREMHFCKDGMSYELHYRFSDSDLVVERFIIDGLRYPEIGRIEDHEFPMLPPLANGIVLLAHMRHHLQTGLGLRQVIDWMMYCDKVLDDAFWDDYFESAAEETGLKKLAITTAFLCQKYLGLRKTITWCKDADEELCDDLMDSLMSSGNFGTKNGSGRSIENAATNLRRVGFLRYLQQAGEHNWKAYHKHPLLKPFCWTYQVFRYLRQGVNAKRGGKLTGDIKRGKQRHELLNRLGLD